MSSVGPMTQLMTQTISRRPLRPKVAAKHILHVPRSRQPPLRLAPGAAAAGGGALLATGASAAPGGGQGPAAGPGAWGTQKNTARASVWLYWLHFFVCFCDQRISSYLGRPFLEIDMMDPSHPPCCCDVSSFWGAPFWVPCQLGDSG